jgi:peptidase E
MDDQSTRCPLTDACEDARVPGHIVAIGGGGGFEELVLSLAGSPRPRVCYLPTAVGDDPEHIVGFYERFGGRACEPYHVRLFGMPERPAERVAAADVVVVSGGNTANLLAVWRVHGVDEALRAVWEAGGVLSGASAGANCWFEASVTDSFGAQLAPLPDGLGLLAGSFCPHYDGEELRRPVYTRLVREDGLAPGLACDDFAAAVFRGTELVEVVAVRADARGYRVERDGETPLPARLL